MSWHSSRKCLSDHLEHRQWETERKFWTDTVPEDIRLTIYKLVSIAHFLKCLCTRACLFIYFLSLCMCVCLSTYQVVHVTKFECSNQQTSGRSKFPLSTISQLMSAGYAWIGLYSLNHLTCHPPSFFSLLRVNRVNICFLMFQIFTIRKRKLNVWAELTSDFC